MKDRFNREISERTEERETENGTITVTTYCVEGLEVEADSLDKALHTLNAMAPEGWVEPEPEEEG